MNAYIGGTIATPVTGLRAGVAWDLLNVNTSPHSGPAANTKVEADAWSLAGYLSYQATEKLSLHGRFEYITGDVDSPGGLGVGSVGFGTLGQDLLDNSIYALTATAQYDLWKNVITRLEFRWDHSEHGKIFGGQTVGAPILQNAYLLAANIIYKF